MNAKNAPASRELRGKLSDGGTVDLVQLGEAVEIVAEAVQCLPGEALQAIVDRIEVGRIDAFKLLGPDRYAELGTDATVWRPGLEARTVPAVYRSAQRGFSRTWPSASDPWATFGASFGPGVVVRQVAPVRPARTVEGRAGLVGPSGLASLLREVAGERQAGAALAALLVAVRRDQLPAYQLDAHPRASPQADVERWGAEYTDEAKPRRLFRVANAVRQRIRPDLPVRLAAAEVTAELRRDPPQGGWFLLQRGCRAKQLSGTELWRRPLSEEKILLAEREGYELEAMHRHWTLRQRDPAWYEVFGDGPSDVAGNDGLFACLRDTWVERATSSEGLDAGVAGSIAILWGDAARLWPESAAEHPALALATPIAASDKAHQTEKPRPEWSDADLQCLVKAWEQECKLRGRRGAAGRVVLNWSTFMPEHRPAVDRRKIPDLLGKAKARGIGASGKTVASVFNLAGVANGAARKPASKGSARKRGAKDGARKRV